MEGKKTYTGLLVLVVGMLGGAQYVSDAEVALAVDTLLQFAGVLVAVYGRLVANK